MCSETHSLTRKRTHLERKWREWQTEAQRDWWLYSNEHSWQEPNGARQSDVSQSTTITLHALPDMNAVCALLFPRPNTTTNSLNCFWDQWMQELSCYWHSFTSSRKFKTGSRTEPTGSTNRTMKNHSVSHEKNIIARQKLKTFHRPSYLILGGNIWLWSNPGKTAGVSWWCAERSPPIRSGWRQAWRTAESTSAQRRKRGRTKVKLYQVLNELMYDSGFITWIPSRITVMDLKE